jgi:hypothetical protein
MVEISTAIALVRSSNFSKKSSIKEEKGEENHARVD